MTATQRLLTGRSSQFADPKGGGSLKLIEHHDFIADATSYTFSGLDGNVDLIYILEHRLLSATTNNTNFILRPNAISTNLSGCLHFVTPSSEGRANLVDWIIGSLGGATVGDVSVGTHKVFCKTGAVRLVGGHRSDWQTGTGVIEVTQTLAWNETVTDITSLKLLADVALGIKAGSFATLYALAR